MRRSTPPRSRASRHWPGNGGIRTAKEALHYLVMVKETLGDAWLTPDLFRFGASSLLTDVTLQIAKAVDGNYQSTDYFSIA